MLKIHNLTPDIFHQNNYYLLTNQKSTMISDYCQMGGIDFMFDEESYLCEVELPLSWNDTLKNIDILEHIDWSYLAKNPSKKIVLTHRIIYNLRDYKEKLNEISLKYNLSERLYWFTFNPLDFKHKKQCKFKLLFLDSLTNVFYEAMTYKTYLCNQRSQEVNDLQKYSYGFEPKDSNFQKLDLDICDKYFISSSVTIKAHRLLSTYLINKNIDSFKGIVSFHGLNDPYLNTNTYLSDHQMNLINHDIDLQEVLDFKSFKQVLDDEELFNPWFNNLRHSYLDLYERCLTNYVNESTSNQSEVFITEKTWINYAHGKPFILNANKNMLTWLEKYYGFKSFPSLFDESYDSKDNFVDRVYYGVDELVKFCSLSFEDAKNKVKSIQKTLDHNYKVFYSINHKERFKKIFDVI